MPRLASNTAINFIKGIPGRMRNLWTKGPAWMQTMGAGWRADAAMLGGVARRAGRIASWPYRGSFERGALFTAGTAAGIGGYYGIRALRNRFNRRDYDAALRRAENVGPRSRIATGYIQRNF